MAAAISRQQADLRRCGQLGEDIERHGWVVSEAPAYVVGGVVGHGSHECFVDGGVRGYVAADAGSRILREGAVGVLRQVGSDGKPPAHVYRRMRGEPADSLGGRAWIECERIVQVVQCVLVPAVAAPMLCQPMAGAVTCRAQFCGRRAAFGQRDEEVTRCVFVAGQCSAHAQMRVGCEALRQGVADLRRSGGLGDHLEVRVVGEGCNNVGW